MSYPRLEPSGTPWKLDFIRGNWWWFLSCHPSTRHQFENFIFEVDFFLKLDRRISFIWNRICYQRAFAWSYKLLLHCLNSNHNIKITNNIALYWIFLKVVTMHFHVSTTVIKDHFPKAERGRYPRWILIQSTGYGKIGWGVIRGSSSSTL